MCFHTFKLVLFWCLQIPISLLLYIAIFITFQFCIQWPLFTGRTKFDIHTMVSFSTAPGHHQPNSFAFHRNYVQPNRMTLNMRNFIRLPGFVSRCVTRDSSKHFDYFTIIFNTIEINRTFCILVMISLCNC